METMELREAVRRFLNESTSCPDSETPLHPSIKRVQQLAEAFNLKFECGEYRFKSADVDLQYEILREIKIVRASLQDVRSAVRAYGPDWVGAEDWHFRKNRSQYE